MIFSTIQFLVVCAFFVFAYHYERNGNPVNLGDFLSRAVWAFVFSAGYIILALTNTQSFVLAYLLFAAFVAILIPHGFAQRMGNRDNTWQEATGSWQKYWPGYWVVWIKNLSNLQQDFLGMLSVGILRGFVVFAPTLFLGTSFIGVLAAIVTTSLGQTFSYYVGWKFPLSIWGNTAKSSEWGEFFVGVIWAISLSLFVWL